jgi:hypothetical protein
MPDVFDHVSCLVGAHRLSDDYIRTFLRQRQCCACPNTARTSRDKCISPVSFFAIRLLPVQANRLTYFGKWCTDLTILVLLP